MNNDPSISPDLALRIGTSLANQAPGTGGWTAYPGLAVKVARAIMPPRAPAVSTDPDKDLANQLARQRYTDKIATQKLVGNPGAQFDALAARMRDDDYARASEHAPAPEQPFIPHKPLPLPPESRAFNARMAGKAPTGPVGSAKTEAELRRRWADEGLSHLTPEQLRKRAQELDEVRGKGFQVHQSPPAPSPTRHRLTRDELLSGKYALTKGDE